MPVPLNARKWGTILSFCILHKLEYVEIKLAELKASLALDSLNWIVVVQICGGSFFSLLISFEWIFIFPTVVCNTWCLCAQQQNEAFIRLSVRLFRSVLLCVLWGFEFEFESDYAMHATYVDGTNTRPQMSRGDK